MFGLDYGDLRGHLNGFKITSLINTILNNLTKTNQDQK